MATEVKYKSEFERLIRERLAAMKPPKKLTWLADKLGVHQKTVETWFKNGGAPIKPPTRAYIAQLLGIPRTELFPEEAGEVPSE